MKKFLSLVLALVMTMSLVTVSAGAKDFTDSGELSGEQYEEAVNVMSEMGIIDGYSDGDFRPQGTLTRGAAAKIIACMMLGKTTAEALGTQAAPFKDVPVGSTFAGYIAYCVESGLIDGYADGTFRPSGTLTGFAFLKMLLTALGYDSSIEGYTGTNWTVNVAGRATQIGLTDGNDDFVGTRAATREEACLYALNALQATLVEYENKGQEIVVSDGTVINVRPSAPTYVTSNVYDAATSINDSTDNVKNGWTVEFAEKYQPKLRLSQTTDEFERPSHTWSWDKKDIGTYLNYDELVAEYTTGVTGKEIYNVLTATTIDECRFYSYLDGAKGNILEKDLARSNNDDLADTDNGVLTQVFVDRNDDEIVITSINTYLAKANADYSADKEYAPLTVYTDISANKKTVTEKSYNVDVEDVPAIADVVDETFYQVTISYKEVSGGEVVTVADAEVLTDSTVTKWSYDDEKVASKLTTDGTEYSAAAKAFYDAEELYAYDESLLTDMSYNIYLDQYGYILGVDLYEGELKYVFITGYDRPSSNLSVSTATAAAIFLDGSMEEIRVNVKDTNENIDESTKTYFGDGTNWNDENKSDGNPIENRWYSYSVNESGVYTLKPADMTITSYASNLSNGEYDLVTIDTANVSVKDSVTGRERVYGEDASVYITVESDVVDTTDGKAEAITEVTGVYTGVQSVDLEVENSAAVVDILENKAQVYTVYDKDNYIIGAVVVGDATGSTANIVYTLGTAKSEELRDGTYYWEFDVVMNGEIQTLTVKSKYDDVIDFIRNDRATRDGIVELRFDADGYVVKAVDVTDIYDYNDAIGAPGADDITDCDVYAVENPTGKVLTINLQGRTMYITPNQDDFGLAIAKDAKAVVIQDENKKTNVKTEFDSVEAAISRLADANTATPNVLDYDGRIIAVLNSNGTAAWVVFDNDSMLTTGTSQGGSVVTPGVEVTINASNEVSVKTTDKHLENDEALDAVLAYLRGLGLTVGTPRLVGGIYQIPTFYTLGDYQIPADTYKFDLSDLNQFVTYYVNGDYSDPQTKTEGTALSSIFGSSCMELGYNGKRVAVGDLGTAKVTSGTNYTMYSTIQKSPTETLTGVVGTKVVDTDADFLDGTYLDESGTKKEIATYEFPAASSVTNVTDNYYKVTIDHGTPDYKQPGDAITVAADYALVNGVVTAKADVKVVDKDLVIKDGYWKRTFTYTGLSDFQNTTIGDMTVVSGDVVVDNDTNEIYGKDGAKVAVTVTTVDPGFVAGASCTLKGSTGMTITGDYTTSGTITGSGTATLSFSSGSTNYGTATVTITLTSGETTYTLTATN